MMPRPYKELKPKFDQLAAVEPRLAALERRAAHVGERMPTRYQLNTFYQELKPVLCTLVGDDCHRRELETEAAYNCVYMHLLSLAIRKAYRRAGGWCK